VVPAIVGATGTAATYWKARN